MNQFADQVACEPQEEFRGPLRHAGEKRNSEMAKNRARRQRLFWVSSPPENEFKVDVDAQETPTLESTNGS